MLVMFGVLIREPVTTTSWIVVLSSAACVGSATTAAPAALAHSARLTALRSEQF
jgi:hypothetical protein